MADDLSKSFSMKLAYSDSGFNAGMTKSAQKAELFNKEIEKTEKGVKETLGKALPKSANDSKAAINELSKSAQKLRERIEKAGKTQTRKEFEKLSKSAAKLEAKASKLAKNANVAKGRLVRLSKSAKDARPNIAKLDNATRGLNSRFLALGSSLLIGSAVKAYAESLLEVEKATAEVATITDLSREDVQALTEDVRDMATAFGVEGVEATKALYQALSASVEPAKAVAFLADSAKLSTAGLATLTESTDLLTSALNSYGLGAEEAGRISDIFFQTVEDGKTTIPEIAASFGKIGSSAANAGVSLEELGAGIATLTKSGLSTSEAITGLQQVIKAFLKPTTEAREAAEKLGLDMSATALKSKGLEGVIGDLNAALSNAEAQGQNSSEILQVLIGRVEGANAATNLAVNGFESFNKSLSNSKNAAGATDRAYGRVSNTVGFQLKQVLAAAKNELNKLGQSFLGGAVDSIKFLGGVENIKTAMQGMRKIVEGFSGLLVAGFKNQFNQVTGSLDIFITNIRIKTNELIALLKEIELKSLSPNSDYEAGRKLKIEIGLLEAQNKVLKDGLLQRKNLRIKSGKELEGSFKEALQNLKEGGKDLSEAYSGMTADIKKETIEDLKSFGTTLGTMGLAVMAAKSQMADFALSTIPALTFGASSAFDPPKRETVDLSKATNTALIRKAEEEYQARLKESIEAEKDSAQDIQEIRNQSNRIIIDEETRHQDRLRGVIRRSAGQVRIGLSDTLSRSFSAGINQAAPVFSSVLARTLSASAQSGVTFRGSSLQAGQGTRQQLQDSLFNRQATGRQLATNIQLLAAGFSSGGTVPGVDQGRDSVLAPLRPGEEVIRPEAARPNRELLKAINRSRGPIVLPRRSEQVVFPGQASGDRITNNSASNSSSVVNNSAVTNNRSSVNVRGGINVSVPGVDPKSIANAVVREIQYKMRRGLMNGGAL